MDKQIVKINTKGCGNTDIVFELVVFHKVNDETFAKVITFTDKYASLDFITNYIIFIEVYKKLKEVINTTSNLLDIRHLILIEFKKYIYTLSEEEMYKEFTEVINEHILHLDIQDYELIKYTYKSISHNIDIFENKKAF